MVYVEPAVFFTRDVELQQGSFSYYIHASLTLARQGPQRDTLC